MTVKEAEEQVVAILQEEYPECLAEDEEISRVRVNASERQGLFEVSVFPPKSAGYDSAELTGYFFFRDGNWIFDGLY